MRYSEKGLINCPRKMSELTGLCATYTLTEIPMDSVSEKRPMKRSGRETATWKFKRMNLMQEGGKRWASMAELKGFEKERARVREMEELDEWNFEARVRFEEVARIEEWFVERGVRFEELGLPERERSERMWARWGEGNLEWVRRALGMTRKEMAECYGVSRQAMGQLLERDARGALKVATLRGVLERLGCDMQLVVSPVGGRSFREWRKVAAWEVLRAEGVREEEALRAVKRVARGGKLNWTQWAKLRAAREMGEMGLKEGGER